MKEVRSDDQNEEHIGGSQPLQSQEESDIQEYNLIKDRKRRQMRPPMKYGYADLISYALNVADTVIDENSRTYK